MKRRTFLQIIPGILLFPSPLRQKKNISTRSSLDPHEYICKEKFSLAQSRKLHDIPLNNILIEMAQSFIGSEYSAGTLEAPGTEQLIVNLQKFDCVTFYENSLVLARCIKKGTTTFQDFKREVQFIRYRSGIIDGYPSRLHYTSDYFYDNQKKHVLKDITKDIGGIPFTKKIHFMSTHPESYPRLKESSGFRKAIQNIEDEINSRTLYHIPKANIQRIALHIQDGDILGITTNIEGLDCSHTGIAYWQKKKLYMLHASVSDKKVQTSKLPLHSYLAKNKKHTGIMVARPLEPMM